MLRAVNVQLLLSIPLNGFLIMYSRVQFERLRRAFNSIEWIHGFYSRKLSFVDEELSIPLNGFCIITAYVVCGNFSISIHMDSIQLSPREGAS